MDHLSETFIEQDGYSPQCGYTPLQIKEAALCLMLNPNAYWARFTLVCYAMHKKVLSARPIDMAHVALSAHRVARGIHTYDREKQSLRKFIFRCYSYAEDDIRAMLRQPVPQGEYIGRKPQRDKPLEALLMDHSGTERFNKLMDGLFGSFITMPLKKRDEDGKPEPLHFWQYNMSFDEVRRALELCIQKNTPVGIQMTGLPLLTTRGERAKELQTFEIWCRLNKPPQFYQEAERRICELYHVDGVTAIKKIVATLKAENHERTENQVKSCIYDKFKKLLPAVLSAAENVSASEESSGGAST